MTLAARNLTAQGIALAVSGAPRIEQTVTLESTIYNGSPLGPRHIVNVDGHLYECGDRSLALLRSGMSPDDLELDCVDDEPEAAGEHPDSLRRWHMARVL